jgi:hypothetical protein
MKWFLALAAALTVAGQSTVDTYTYDINGARVAGPQTVASDHTRTERTRSINGRTVPLERSEERVLRSDSSGKITERIVRRYSPDGQQVQVERILVEEQTRADGSSQVRTSTYQTDANGNPRLVERSLAENRKTASGSTSEVTIEKPSVNGSFETAERRLISEQTTANGLVRNTAIFRRDENGRLFEAGKETVERTTAGDESTESTTRYDALSPSSRMELSGITRKTTLKQAGGSESIVVDVYGPYTPGSADYGSGRPHIKEQQVIQRQVSGNRVVETLAVRRPSLADPNMLGAEHKVSETVCTGQCK